MAKLHHSAWLCYRWNFLLIFLYSYRAKKFWFSQVCVPLNFFVKYVYQAYVLINYWTNTHPIICTPSLISACQPGTESSVSPIMVQSLKYEKKLSLTNPVSSLIRSGSTLSVQPCLSEDFDCYSNLESLRNQCSCLVCTWNCKRSAPVGLSKILSENV